MIYRVPLMRPSLPNLQDYTECLEDIWERKMLSNFSKYSTMFECRTQEYFKTKVNFLATSSCDIGLALLIKSFDFPEGSEIIVPSFTFNSTVNTVEWNGLKPVFVDINRETFNIDTHAIEYAITKKTKAIIGVHIFGNTCDVAALEQIASKYNLKLGGVH